MHPIYADLIEKAERSHSLHRSPAGITAKDVGHARLYCYAFRLHAIGAFHATRLAIAALPEAGPLSAAWRLRATEALSDLADQAMEGVPADFRAVISTLHRYHRGVERVLDSLRRDLQAAPHPVTQRIERLFRSCMEEISGGCGIHITQDTQAPEQASFVVPNLGIVIVPLVYGDHHSWNLAYLGGSIRNVPTHRHRHGVEIHLGYNPTHGLTVLGSARAAVDDGYAMPIPPETDHGWVNTSEQVHHVPFIFGSARHGGWGVFLDVEPRPQPIEHLTRLVDRDSPPFAQMIYLEREIQQIETMRQSWRKILIPHTVTSRHGSGGLELGLTRINQSGYSYPRDDFRIISITRGTGLAEIEEVQQQVRAHDHFGVPAGMTVTLRQMGADPLVALDTILRTTDRPAPA